MLHEIIITYPCCIWQEIVPVEVLRKILPLSSRGECIALRETATLTERHDRHHRELLAASIGPLTSIMAERLFDELEELTQTDWVEEHGWEGDNS